MRNIALSTRAQRFLSKAVKAVAGVAIALGVVSSAPADDLLFDWRTTSGAPAVSGYTPAPFITNSMSPAQITAVQAQLTAQQIATPGKVAVKVMDQLSAPNLSAIFNNPNYTVNYVFQDLEGVDAHYYAQQQASAIRNLNTTKNGSIRIGNFALFPGNGDNSGTGVYSGPSSANYRGSFTNPPSPSTINITNGVNMANEDLYPGSWTYKDPGQVGGGTATSPNIRSALFALPIKRTTWGTVNLPAGHINLPYINRFDSHGNPQLNNGTSNGVPAFYADAAHGTAGQMLSRNDFKAMAAHYRLRGVAGMHLLDGGVEGYTPTQFMQDAKDGWHGLSTPTQATSPWDALFAAGGRPATLDTVATIDGVTKDIELAGVVYSGVYSLSANKLAMLVSNMDGAAHDVTFTGKPGGKNIPTSYVFNILGGEHRLIEFTGTATQWQLSTNNAIFNLTFDGNENSRDGIGVPEPVTMGSVSLFAMMLLVRRNRRK